MTANTDGFALPMTPSLASRIDAMPTAPAVSGNTASAFPVSINIMSVGDIAEAMQHAAGLVSWAESLLSEVEAKYIYATERCSHEIELAVALFRQQEPTVATQVGKTIDALRAYVIEQNAILKKEEEERWTLRSQKHRLEHLLAAYTTARDTLSRQVEVKRMEQGR